MATPQPKQVNRLLELKTPLGTDVLVINGFSGSESLSGLFRYKLQLLNANTHPKIESLLGKGVHIGMRDSAGVPVYFHGMVSRISAGDRDKRFQQYEAEIVPWLWLLTRKADVRIFQGKSAIEIIKAIFDEFQGKYSDIVKYRDATNGSYTKIDYCVQYRETSFNFVSRLMEQYGISYFFEHDENGHTLVLADAYPAYKVLPNHNAIRYDEGGYGDRDDTISDWHARHELRSSKFTLRDYHLELSTKDNEVNEGDSSLLEVYDFPGGYAVPFNATDSAQHVHPEGEAAVKTRIQEEELNNYVCEAISNCRNVRPGYKFTLQKHFNADGEYIITGVSYSVRQTPDYYSGDEVKDAYTNSFVCVKSKTPIRPRRVTPKPIVAGPQTATVTVKSGEESWLDKYGRVRVQFHWDREGKNNEKSTCWVRVSQAWAANKWGAHFWPRVGQEVVVTFLEGDPDQPIITGSVYNAANMPPYQLPNDYTRSGIKTRSSKQGGNDNYNELRFEDKKGSEQIFLNAEKDMDLRVENDYREIVCNDSHHIVLGGQVEETTKDKHVHLKADYFEKIDANVNRSVGSDEKELIKGKSHRKVNGAMNEKIGDDFSLEVGQNTNHKSSMKHAIEAGQEVHIKGGMKVILEAGMQLTIKAAGGFVDIGPAGVTIQGLMVKINSGGAAGSGSGCSPKPPEEPKDPKEPVVADDGSKGGAGGKKSK